MPTIRQREYVTAVFHRPLYPIANKSNRGAIRTTDFHTHQRYIWSHTCLSTATTITTYRAGTMSAMSTNIHGIIIVICDVPTIVGKSLAAIPQMFLEVEMIVIDTHIYDRYHHALARVSQIPHLVSIYLSNIRRNVSSDLSLSRVLVFGDFHIRIKANDFHILSFGQIINSLFGSRKIKCVGHPKDSRSGHHVVFLHFSKTFSDIDELAPLGTGRVVVSTTVQLFAIVLLFHDDEHVDFLVVIPLPHLFLQSGVDVLGITHNAGQCQQDNGKCSLHVICILRLKLMIST